MALVVTGLEQRILELIPQIRAEHHACTARQLSNVLNMHHTHISNKLRLMRATGLIGFTEMPGSLHVMGTVEMLPDGTVIDPPPPVEPTPNRGKRTLGAQPANYEKLERAKQQEREREAKAPKVKAPVKKSAK